MQTVPVVAAVLKDVQGRVLVTQRPAGKPLAGYWEFPGGKLESGEPPFAALQRELREELGLDVQQARPLLQLSHDYAERRVELAVWRVTRWQGAPCARESQAIAWVKPDELSRWRLLPADTPVVQRLRLPPCMLVTPSPEDGSGFLMTLERRLAEGREFVQFRAPALPERQYGIVARKVIRLCREYGARVVLNAEPELARQLGADGAHLSGAKLGKLARRPLPQEFLVGASCHEATDIRRAAQRSLDYVVLGAVRPSASHPGREPLGWETFAELAAGSSVPVYAIGGLAPAELETVRTHGGYGLAAMRALWQETEN